jgi:hypothetical protein
MARLERATRHLKFSPSHRIHATTHNKHDTLTQHAHTHTHQALSDAAEPAPGAGLSLLRRAARAGAAAAVAPSAWRAPDADALPADAVRAAFSRARAAAAAHPALFAAAARAVRRAAALYRLSRAPPLKALLIVALAGFPDVGAAAAIGALEPAAEARLEGACGGASVWWGERVVGRACGGASEASPRSERSERIGGGDGKFNGRRGNLWAPARARSRIGGGDGKLMSDGTFIGCRFDSARVSEVATGN